MKTLSTIAIISITLLFSSCSYIADLQVDPKSDYYYYSWNKKAIYYKYVETTGGMFPLPTGVSRSKIEDADAKTFVVLTSLIAKDKNYVYCKGAKVIDSDVSEFCLISGNVYKGAKIVSADAASFCHISGKLYKDKDHVFLHDTYLTVIEDADPETYTYYHQQQGLAKDKNGYFYREKRINVDIPTFEVLSEFAHGGFDKNFVYIMLDSIHKVPIQGKLTKVNDKFLYDDYQVFRFIWTGRNALDTIPIKNKKSFMVYESPQNTIFKLNGKLYWNNYEIKIKEILDINSFEYIGGSYAKDAQTAYYIRNTQNNNVITLMESNPATFKFIEGELAYDRKYVYYRGEVVSDADPHTIQKTKEGLRDKNYEWKWNREKRKWDKIHIENERI